jgi:hypothetical protein
MEQCYSLLPDSQYTHNQNTKNLKNPRDVAHITQSFHNTKAIDKRKVAKREFIKMAQGDRDNPVGVWKRKRSYTRRAAKLLSLW